MHNLKVKVFEKHNFFGPGQHVRVVADLNKLDDPPSALSAVSFETRFTDREDWETSSPIDLGEVLSHGWDGLVDWGLLKKMRAEEDKKAQRKKEHAAWVETLRENPVDLGGGMIVTADGIEWDGAYVAPLPKSPMTAAELRKWVEQFLFVE